jgi:DNA-binding winged helix-turn-helix (wHTH) protein
MADPQWCFADFRLDPTNARLWQGAQVIALTPKVFDVLHYLVTHADRLVTKDALLDAVWPETAVSDGVVRMAIGDLRRALGDTAQAPRYIATVQRRGYRFVAPVTCVTPEAAPPAEATPAPLAPPSPAPPLLPRPPHRLCPRRVAWPQSRWPVNASRSRCCLPISKTRWP